MRHLGSIPEESVSRYKAQILTLSEGHVLVRKARKFELPSSNIIKMGGEYQIDPPPGKIGLKDDC